MKYQIKAILVVIIAGIALVALASEGLHRRFKQPRQTHHAALPVSATIVQSHSAQNHVIGTGVIHTYEGTTLMAETSGHITHIDFQSGDTIQAGQTLVTLEHDTQSSTLRQAQADLKMSEKKYLRLKKLYQTSAISTADYEQAKYTYQSNLARVQVAQANFNKTIIKAPFNGTLGLKHISLGQYMTPGTAIVKLDNLNRLYVDFSIPAPYLPQLKVGQSVQIAVGGDHTDQPTISGTLLALDTDVQESTGTILLRASISKPIQLLRPGEFATVTMPLGLPKHNLLVSQTAIQYANDGDAVYRIINNHAIKTSIQIAGQMGQTIEVKSAMLHSGDAIVQDINARMHDKMPVHIVSTSRTLG